MLVLAIDTSSAAVTAGVARLRTAPVDTAPVDTDGGNTNDAADVAVLVEHATVAARGHGELLAPSISRCLADAGLRPADLGAVVAGVGPGPYTGLRVGLVTAAALADAVGVPAYGVCSLDAIAAALPDEPDLLVATDARRREVYWARYRRGVRVGEPAVGPAAGVPIDGVTAVAGAGVDLFGWPVPHRPQRFPTTAALVACARDRITSGEPGDPLSPLYLRRPDAVVPGAPKAVRQ